MAVIKGFAAAFLVDRAAVTALEYALIAGLLASVVVGGMSGVGANLARALAGAGAGLSDGSTAASSQNGGFAVVAQRAE